MQNNEQAPISGQGEQGGLFEVDFVSNGATDAGGHAVEARFMEAPDGVYPETVEQVQPDPVPTAEDISVSEAVKTTNRHNAQLAKHSSLARTGTYSGDLRLGDFLPGFGPVREEKWEEAKLFARQLDEQRKRQ